MSGILHSRLVYLILFAFAAILYANTLFHGFVLDDEVAITKNEFVQQCVKGIPAILTHDSFAGYGRIGEGESTLTGGRYRPLSVIVFAILFDAFGSNPIPFHLLNILVYGLGSISLFVFLCRLLRNHDNGRLSAFIVTAVFIAHPVHTEVVANAKSLDELLVLIFGMVALTAMIQSHDKGTFHWFVLAGVSMLAACFAKENGVMLLLVAPFVFYFFRKTTLQHVWRSFVPLLLAVCLFLLARFLVIGNMVDGRMMQDPLNNPFLEWTGSAWVACSGMTKLSTILLTLGGYLKLMVFPYPLTHDYYPFHIALQSFSNPIVILSILVLIGLISLTIWGSIRKKVWAFGLLFFLITGSVSSNLFFPVGTFMAERFLFLPSLGIIFFLTLWLIPIILPRHKRAGVIFFAVSLFLFSGMTILRNQAWKSNEQLMATDIRISENSIRLQNQYGTLLLDKALQEENAATKRVLLEQASGHLVRATEMNPLYYDARLASGACHYYLEEFEQSAENYRSATIAYPGDEKAVLGLHYALRALGEQKWSVGDSLIAIAHLSEAWELIPDAAVADQIALWYEVLNKEDLAEEWRLKAFPNH